MTHHQLSRSTPEAQGVSSSAISSFIEAVEQQDIELHSMLLMRHSHVIAEAWWSPYSPDRIHLLYSLSKGFTSTAIGIAIDEGILSVDDLVLSFFPDKKPEIVSEHLANMRVHHLLSMSTGHIADALERMIEKGDGDWVAGFLAIPPDQAPGTVFTYNNAATFMLSAILQNLTGMKLVEYLQPRLFEPLGIRETHWLETPQGINQGFSGLHITTESIARLGQLYLQKGEWQGRQLVSKQWVEQATAKQISHDPSPEDEMSDWSQGYGYQFWQCCHHAYRAAGAFGQFCLVMPDQDAVLAITAGVENMQSTLNLVWEHLLPAMNNDPLPDVAETQQILARQLEGLRIQPPQGEISVKLAERVSGQVYDFVYTVGEDDLHEIRLRFQQDFFVLVAVDDQGEHRIECGYNTWRAGTTAFCAPEVVPILSGGAWTSPNILSLAIRHIQTPHCLGLTFYFDADTVWVNGRWNVMFGAAEIPEVAGQLRP